MSLWITHLLELVNSLSMPQEKMEATKNLILVEISKIKILKNPQERDEKLEAIAKQLLLLFFEESNAEGVFKDVITKNSEPYQSLLTKKPLKQAAQYNILGDSACIFLVAMGSWVFIQFFKESPVSEAIEKTSEVIDKANKGVVNIFAEALCYPLPVGPLKSWACGDEVPITQVVIQATGNNSWSKLLPLIGFAAILFSIVFWIRYNNRRKKLLFIQAIFSIYSYKFQNGLEKL